jgi:hypothetical protein
MTAAAVRSIQLVGALVVSTALAITPPALGAASTVRVPAVTGLSAGQAYSMLHGLGLKVSLPRLDLQFVVDPPDHVVAATPSAGQRVDVGDVVSLALGCSGCVAGSPSVPVHMPRYRVPAFIGRTVERPHRWVVHKELFYAFHLGRLVAGNASTLFGNYRVTRQSPRPGRELALGRGTRCCHGTGGTFRPTPLAMWATAR